jgi:hypothetical protein
MLRSENETRNDATLFGAMFVGETEQSVKQLASVSTSISVCEDCKCTAGLIRWSSTVIQQIFYIPVFVIGLFSVLRNIVTFLLFNLNYTGCPTCYRTLHFFNNFTTNEDIATKFETDLPHCVRNVKEKNGLLFKFRYNIFIGVTIIKEMLSSVASGAFCS